MKKLDLYIIKKFLGTFVFTMILMLAIAVVIDISEKVDNFIKYGVSTDEIIYDYYVNFLLYFGNLFMPLVVFLAAILFTSRMAEQTEIVAYLAGGISFNRLLFPYFISASLLTAFSLYLNHQILPNANQHRKNFETKFVAESTNKRVENIHKQIRPNEYLYIQSYNPKSNSGYNFAIEKYSNDKMSFRMSSDWINYNEEDSIYTLRNWKSRIITDTHDIINRGNELDTTFAFSPKDLTPVEYVAEIMPYSELSKFIEDEEFRGSENLSIYKVEMYKRTSMPISTYILTLIAVSLSFRKKRGGMGLNIATGLALVVIYLFFMKIADTFAIKDDFQPLLAVWVPNITFGLLSLFLYNDAKK